MTDPRIELRIESTRGGAIEDEYNPNQKVEAVKVTAMKALDIQPSKQDEYQLVLDNQPLDDDKSLEDVGVTDGATLILAPIQAEVI